MLIMEGKGNMGLNINTFTEITLYSKQRVEFIDLTAEINLTLKECSINEGICSVFVPHTTAGLTINENADPDVKHDIINFLNKLVPFSGEYRHLEGNSDAHIKASLMGPSLTIPVHHAKLALGTWQGVYFCEFDGPRKRKVYIKIIGLK
jgi:secondary thiamine-phosphate synthase enzyme